MLGLGLGIVDMALTKKVLGNSVLNKVWSGFREGAGGQKVQGLSGEIKILNQNRKSKPIETTTGSAAFFWISLISFCESSESL